MSAVQHHVDAPLDELELRVLDFERAWASRVGAKEAAIRAEFGLPAARYYQMLYALIDSPAALQQDPLLVRRLQRLRDARARSRAARTFRSDTATTQDTTD
ncbi:DUF3263 domain-containing protein [Lysinimonas soli]|uniref:DUF3263 domain-containing protein n=1 Tax=Lysinimonas soli TaxID=1074233 RepID=A0ABW0NJS8_9MICO